MKTWHLVFSAMACAVLLFAAAIMVDRFPVMSLLLASLEGVIVGHVAAWHRFRAALDNLGLRVKQEKARVVDLKSRRVLYVDPADDKDAPLFG